MPGPNRGAQKGTKAQATATMGYRMAHSAKETAHSARGEATATVNAGSAAVR